MTALRGDASPSRREPQRAADRRCPGLGSTRRRRWEGPSKDARRVGHRTMVCHSRTSDRAAAGVP